MKNHIFMLIILLLLMLNSCTTDIPAENDIDESNTTKTDLIAEKDDIQEIEGYSSFYLSKYGEKYAADDYISSESRGSTFLYSMLSEKITEYEYGEYTFLLFKDSSGKIIFAGGKGAVNDVLYYITQDDWYAYPLENIQIEEFQNVLSHNGVILSFLAGAASRPIIYWACDDNGIYPIAVCDMSNYEIDVTGDGINDIIMQRMGKVDIIYRHDNELYITYLNDALYKELGLSGLAGQGGYYDYESDMFEFSFFDEQEATVEAFIKDGVLYNKNR
jgi:PAS domain-containing protein